MDFDGAGDWDPDEVDRFIDKIANEFRLEYLSICHSPIPRATLERLFRATPHIKVLDAQIYDDYENFFEALTISQSPSQCFLPRLKTLVLEQGISAAVNDDEGETINPDAFAPFLESRMRCAPEDRLRKIVLYGRYPDQVSDETPVVQVIQRYLPEGLSLERQVVTELRRGRLNSYWMERDPELQDWLEANVISWRETLGLNLELSMYFLPSTNNTIEDATMRRNPERTANQNRGKHWIPYGSQFDSRLYLQRRTRRAKRWIMITRTLSVGVSILDPLLVPFTTSLTSLVLSQVPILQIHALPSGLFPSLERLVLYIDEDDYQQNTWLLNGPVAAFESAPVLQRVATNKILAGSGAISFRLPWQQLTYFIEDDCDKNTHRFLIDILPQCVTLRWLGILLPEADLGQGFEELWDNQPVRIMPSLRSLSLDLEGDQYPNFFDNFKFPELRALRLKGGYMDFNSEHANANSWDPDEVNRFFDKIENEFRLDYLSVCANLIYRSTLERLFRATPHVTVLDAHIWEKFEHLFETLTISQSPSQCFLPRLKTLVLELGSSIALEYDEGETIDPDAFASFLESRMRCAPEGRLRKIVLYGRYPDQVSNETPFVQVIQRYLPEGLLLERQVVTELRHDKVNVDWTERDPELQDWLEANAINWSAKTEVSSRHLDDKSLRLDQSRKPIFPIKIQYRPQSSPLPC
ncbi:hypothetical protein H1R20_g4315, partial [Candolleomyces eurysporus]